MIVDTAIKDNYICDLLILDECHNYASDEGFLVFSKIKYKFILGLTATIARLDGKHKLIEEIIPIVATVPLSECLKNKWVSEYNEYKVLLEVDVSEYQKWKLSLMNSLSFFNNDLNLALAMLDPKQIGKKIKFMRDTGYNAKEIIIPAMNVSRMLEKMNTFVMEHPKKIEITNKILENRKETKSITFSLRSATAKEINRGETIHSKISKKKRKEIIDRFKLMSTGNLNAVKVLDEGEDIQGINMLIVLCNTSSNRQKTQRLKSLILNL